MRRLMIGAVLALGVLGGAAHADWTTNDEIFANAALRELHDLARASAQLGQAAKDGDDLGIQDAYASLQSAAHESLTDMHRISLEPVDAIEDVSEVLRVADLARSGNEFADEAVVTVAGQAITELRWDYAIGPGDWYMVKANGDIEAENPVSYAQSLRDQGYSWVGVSPKDDFVVAVSDWKAELDSLRVDDPSIEDYGIQSHLDAVEVDYRKNSDDDNTRVYFYRTRGAAVAAETATTADMKSAADSKASDADWEKKFTELPYMIANHDAGFKLVYDPCREKKGSNICDTVPSYDLAGTHGAPYQWFADEQSCENDPAANVRTEYVGSIDIPAPTCLPAPKPSGHTLRGYKMVFSLVPPNMLSPQAMLDPKVEVEDITFYAELRKPGFNSAAVFKTFAACDAAMDAADSKALKDLGATEDGTLLSDKDKSIDLTATVPSQEWLKFKVV
jgi:hypothetical protein